MLPSMRVSGSRVPKANSNPPNPQPMSTISIFLFANIVGGYKLVQSMSDGLNGLRGLV
jgi:hypothetical protein